MITSSQACEGTLPNAEYRLHHLLDVNGKQRLAIEP